MAEPGAVAPSPADRHAIEKSIEGYKLSFDDGRSMDRRPSIELRPEGWRLRWNGREVSIFGDVMGLEVNLKIAKELGIKPDEAWRIKTTALNAWWPRSLDEVRALFPGIVGEDQNIKLAVLALFSLKLHNPEERIMGIIIQAVNSAGKSYFAKAVLKPFRPLENGEFVLEFTRMTGAYLERKFKDKDLDRRILFIQETEDAPTQLHLTLSEGKLKVGLVERSNGEFRPVEIEAKGQPFLLATTVNWKGSPDLIHRCILMELDESPEQTRRIIEFETMMAKDFLYRERFEALLTGCEKIFRRLWQETPENVEVVIPYLTLIQERLKVGDPSVKLRRDWNKLIALIKASAILFHKHRPIIKLGNRTVIVSTFEDFKQVLSLIETSLRQTLSNISEKEAKVIEALREIEEAPEMANFTSLGRRTGIPASTLRHHIIPSLEAKGIVVVDRDSRPHRIELLKEGGEFSIEVEGLEDAAEKLIKDAVETLLSSGGQLANHEISPDNPLIPENKPEELAIPGTANPPSDLAQNKEGEGSVSDWPFGRGERIAGDQLYWVKPGWGEYRGPDPLGPLGLSIALRRRIKEFGGEAGLLLAAEESLRWPLLAPLKADNLVEQGEIIRKLTNHYRGLKASEKTVKTM